LTINSVVGKAPQVRINEVAWMGTQVSYNNEWIELYNAGESKVDLAGWQIRTADGQPKVRLTGSIRPQGYYLLERTNDKTLPNLKADSVYTGSLSNSGEVLELIDSSSSTSDIVSAADGWPAGDNKSKQTMERGPAGGWQTSKKATGTPKAVNSSGIVTGQESNNTQDEPVDDGQDDKNNDHEGEPGKEEADGREPGRAKQASTSPVLSETHHKLHEVVINEFVSDPADGEEEWVELYNRTGNDIDLEGWTLEEGAGSQTPLAGEVGLFKLIEQPKGHLNNSGDIIKLKDPAGNLIDQVAYGDWDDGNPANNAPAAKDPWGTARKIDGRSTGNGQKDFAITTTLTKSAANQVTLRPEEREIDPKMRAQYDYAKSVVISELFPNPAASDRQSEFIEFYNTGKKAVDLAGWQVRDESKRKYEFPEPSMIKPGGFYVLKRAVSGLALNNTGDTVKLTQPFQKEAFIEISYGRASEAKSYANTKYGTSSNYIGPEAGWVWSDKPTPGKINVLDIPNHPPDPAFSLPGELKPGQPIRFDSSDTIDLDRDRLAFSWDFGDGITNRLAMPVHTYLKPGQYAVKLAVWDGQATATQSRVITVGQISSSSIRVKGVSSQGLKNRGDIIFTEIMPSPAGSDKENEWIELYNRGGSRVNLRDWRVEDEAENGYSWKSDHWFKPESYYLLERSKSDIALNNSGDNLRLYGPLDKLRDNVTYTDAPEGRTYNLGKNGKWFWSLEPTPAKSNRITLAQPDTTASNFQTANRSYAAFRKREAQDYPLVPLTRVSEHKAGEQISVQGTVAVLPGVLGLQYFYIVGSPGLQIYNYNKEFPSNIKVGDMIEARGELSEARGEMRLKTDTAEDIRVIASLDPPEPARLKCAELDNGNLGRLVRVGGEVVSDKGSRVYLDDGTGEIAVYIKEYTDIDTGAIEVGGALEATGIVGRTRLGLRLMPRSSADIEFLASKPTEDVPPADPEDGTVEERVLGQTASRTTWHLSGRDSRVGLYKYLLVLSGIVIAVLLVYILKEKHQEG